MEAEAVTDFREYIRIPSVHPNVDYSECVKFLTRLAEKNGLKCTVAGTSSKPVVIITWEGVDKKAGSILLNSHMDVVPVFKEHWTYDPFEAVKDSKGNIYGRGTQDIKCQGIAYIAAVRKLKDNKIRLKRTINILFVPDEEIGGVEGMGKFVQSDDFRKLNVVFGIDEGNPSADGESTVYNDERCSTKIKIYCNGPTGHGSLLHKNTAGEKFRKVLDAFMDLRETHAKEFKKHSENITKLAEVTTINLTEIKGGIQNNVVPDELILGFDVRLSIHENHEEFYNWVEDVCKCAGDDVFVEYDMKEPKAPRTATDSSNPFWKAFEGVMDKMNIPLKVSACFGCSDARYLRRIGVPTLGFSPFRFTPMLLHDNDEMLNESVFLEGINVFENLIEALGNI